MTQYRDCRDCKYNSYIGVGITDWVSCGHPTTLSKLPKYEPGDPAWVDYMTADVRVSMINDLQDCSAWEAIAGAAP